MNAAEHTLASIIIGIALATCGSMCGDAHAQPIDAARLERALRVAVSVGAPERVPVAHCRHAGPRMPSGLGRWARCERRLARFATYFERAGRTQHVSAWTLAAMALRESGLNPWAQGPAGEGGVMQLHPRGIGAHEPFVRSERYRRQCRHAVGACQWPIVLAGARHLARWIARCGSESSALGGYNRGRCGETAYSRGVASTRARLRASAND